MDDALETNFAQDFDLNVNLNSVDVASAVKLRDAKRHASLLSSFLLENSSYCGVKKIIYFQKLVGNFKYANNC